MKKQAILSAFIAAMTGVTTPSAAQEKEPVKKEEKVKKLIGFNLDGLTNQNGDKTEHKNYKEKLLIYVGYPDCIHVCPPALAVIRKTMEEEKYKNISILLVSASTPGDSPKKMKRWIDQNFSKVPYKVYGVTEGEKGKLAALQKALRAKYDGVDGHTPKFFLVDPANKELLSIGNTRPRILKKEIDQALVKQKSERPSPSPNL